MPKIVDAHAYRITHENGRAETLYATLVVAQQSGALFVYNKYEDSNHNTLVGTYAPTYRKFERVEDGPIIAQE